MTAWAVARGQSDVETLAPEFVYSPRIANQEPAASFAMPVSALRYEPRVDVQARNLTEGQADVTIRGGIFENTGFTVGASTLYDPQTGHYFAEIPIAPAMLTAPEVLTGVAHALGTTNSTVGAIAYGWRPIRTTGTASIAAGDYGFNRQEFYQGFAQSAGKNRGHVGADVNWSRSEGDGTIPYGDHNFQRVNARLQYATAQSQTDVFAGYQAKFFGWPNLYTPFNSKESENLETTLFVVNHRVELGSGDFVEAGVYHRRNKDDYAYDRTAAVVGPAHPFQHTTWVNEGAVTLRKDVGAFTLNARAEALSDELHSTSLTAGRYHTRTLTKIAVVPEKAWALSDGSQVVLKAGGTLDDSNRGGSAVSPVFEIAREQDSVGWRRIYFSYAKTTQVPTYTALNSSATAGLFRGNPNLGREISHTVELGASGTAAGWATQAAAFFRRDEGLVDWTFKQGVTARSANPVDIDTGGFEALGRRAWGPVDLVLGYTYLTKSPDYRGALVDASFYALNYARHRLTVAVTARLGAGVVLRMDNVARQQAASLLRTTGGDSAVLSSLTLSWRPPALRRIEFSVGADNLWNSTFEEVPSVPAARRQTFFGVSGGW